MNGVASEGVDTVGASSEGQSSRQKIIDDAFLKNVWYVAGWIEEFSLQGPQGRVIANQPVVFYRTSDGSLTALEDRCPHRWAPLSLGRVEVDALRCMYHGLKFGRDGRCVEIPGQERVSKTLAVRAFPAIERHRFVWVWLGAPERADPELIPNLDMLDDPALRVNWGQLDYQAHAALICDNLLDLSHIAYLHQKTFGGPPQAPTADRPKPRFMGGGEAQPLERGVRVEGWMQSSLYRNVAVPANVPDGDLWCRTDFLLPGIYFSRLQMHPEGTAEACRGAPPGADRHPVSDSMSIQAVTPMTSRSSRYFFSFGARFTDMDVPEQDNVWRIVQATFSEDLAMIHAQQAMIDQYPAARMSGIGADRGLVLFRNLVRKHVTEETAVRPPPEDASA